MGLKNHSERYYARIFVLCAFGIVLILHGSLTLWNLYSQKTLFQLNTIIESLGSSVEIIVSIFLFLLGFYPDDVMQFFEDALNFLQLRY
jgi:hypothetical protein